MKRYFNILFLTILALTAMSCSESRMLQKSLSFNKEPLGYEFTSPIAFGPKTDSLVVLFNGLPLDSLTTVKRSKTFILPLVFFNYFDFKYRINLGANSLKEDYNRFFFNALLDESDRSGQFALCYDSIPSDSVYTLEITLDTCETTCVYQKSNLIIYYFYGYDYSYNERVNPAQSQLSCLTILRKGNHILYEKRIAATNEVEFPGGEYFDRSEMYSNISWQLVESLNRCTKDCISAIVREVNKTIKVKY